MRIYSRVKQLSMKSSSWFGPELVVIAAFYIVFYFNYPATPGNAPLQHPQGWWGWWDQSQYLLSVNALRAGDWTPSNFFYPPLYPFLGGILGGFSTGHAFFLLNLVCLLWFSFVLLKVASQYLNRLISFGIYSLVTIFNFEQFENFVIPWTTTLSVALISCGIYFLFVLRPSTKSLILVSLLLGFVTLTRPLDSLVAAALFALSLFKATRIRTTLSRTAITGALSGAAYLVGPIAFLLFNQFMFQNPLGQYYKLASSNGYFIEDLPEKTYSIFMESTLMYGTSSSSVFAHFPWIALAIPSLYLLMRRKETRKLSIIFLAAALTIFSYLPYADLIPNGFWMYKNVHYFKWIFPYVAICIAVALVYLARDIRNAKRSGKVDTLVCIIILIVSINSLTLKEVNDMILPASKVTAGEKSISFQIGNDLEKIDAIDIQGISADWTDSYFGERVIYNADKSLENVRNFRIVPIKDGLRILFIRPQRVSGEMVLSNTNTFNFRAEPMSVHIKQFEVAFFGIPVK